MRSAGLCLALSLVGVTLPAFAGEEPLSVQVRESAVREKPSALGKVLGKLEYGVRVDVLDPSRKSWTKIRSQTPAPLEGWMRASALTAKRLPFTGTQSASTAVSREEVAMAGKGFDEEVEKKYRGAHRNLDRAFAILDRVEVRPPPTVEEIREFLRKGALTPKETS